MKVHVTIKEEFCGDAASRNRARAEVVAASGLRNINEKRLERFGILSGDVDADRIAALRALPVVASVEVDERRVAL